MLRFYSRTNGIQFRIEIRPWANFSFSNRNQIDKFVSLLLRLFLNQLRAKSQMFSGKVVYKIWYKHREAILEVNLAKLSWSKVILIIFQEFMLEYLSVYNSVELSFGEHFVRVFASDIPGDTTFVWLVFKVISSCVNPTTDWLITRRFFKECLRTARDRFCSSFDLCLLDGLWLNNSSSANNRTAPALYTSDYRSLIWIFTVRNLLLMLFGRRSMSFLNINHKN